ncbi:MAG: DUF427 domain-containing protein [Oscillochloris sp.]|nr:DUF427 domain-containing protein [Oscillochloris sp.]
MIQRIEPGPGQESVWDYPRPPRLEAVTKRIRIILAGEVIADTQGGYRVLETSHPPVYYLPPDDLRMDLLTRTARSSFCEWKGRAAYYTLTLGDLRLEHVAWSYPKPTESFLPIAGYLGFYAGPMDACYVGDEQVIPQPGDFYGGWITGEIVGPFKGGPGSWGW